MRLISGHRAGSEMWENRPAAVTGVDQQMLLWLIRRHGIGEVVRRGEAPAARHILTFATAANLSHLHAKKLLS